MGSAEIAYTDPQGVFGKHESYVEKYLKSLNNLHWRPHNDSSNTDTATRTIPFLKLRLTPEGGYKHRQHQILGLNPPPLVQILIFETTNLEIYRTKLRQIGKDWYSKQVDVRDPTGYIVVHVVSPEDSPKAIKSIWTRLCNEFEPENCIQLFPTSQGSWKELRMLVQQQLLYAFDARVTMLEREIQKLNSTRDIPGWNFGTLFVVNESLAGAYESMNLIDDALRVYKALEELSGGVLPKEWASDPMTLDLGFTGVRDALVEPMLTRKASFFDVERHIVACQVQLYFALASGKHQTDEVVDSLTDKYVLDGIRMAIRNIPRIMSSLVKTVGKLRANVWLLRATRELYGSTAEFGSSKLANGKGDILLIQRDALQYLAGCAGWAIPGIFNDISLDPQPESIATELEQFPELKNEAEFQSEFIKITRTALGYFRVANLRRSVNRLSGQLALIEYNIGHIETAWDIFQKSPLLLQGNSVQDHNVVLLEMAMECAGKLGLDNKVMECAWQIIGVKEKAPLSLYRKAIGNVEKLNTAYPLTHELSQWFVPKLIPYLRGDSRGYYLEIDIQPKKSDYPFISFTNAKMVGTMSSAFGPEKQIVFETTEFSENNAAPIRLSCKTFVQGILSFSGFTIEAGKQVFIHTFEEPILVAMKPLSTAVNASLRLGKKYTMRKRSVEMLIRSPSEIQKAKVTVQATDPNVQFLWDQADIPEKLENFKTATVSIPILIDYSNPHVTLRVYIQYDDEHTYESLETLDFSLLVSVDFQEYYREPPKILLQFLVKPFQLAPITFSSAHLRGSTNYNVNEKFGSSQFNKEYVAYSNAPISYIFSLDKSQAEPTTRKSAQPMALTLTYRSMLWEIRHLLYTRLISNLDPEIAGYTLVLGNIVEALCGMADLKSYATTGHISILNDTAGVVSAAFQYMDPSHMESVHQHILRALEPGVSKQETNSFDELNSQITLEVPDPDASVVHYVKLYSKQAATSCAVGEVLPMELEIDTICIQGEASLDNEYEYLFDRLSDGWSYTGKVTGSFTGKDKVKESLNLIPHRSGELHLPNVVIRPKKTSSNTEDPDSSVEIMGSESIVVASHANTQILVVPDVNMLAITF